MAQKGAQHQAIGRSRGGLTTKVLALVDALGNLFDFLLLPGQAHNMKGIAPLIEGVDALLTSPLDQAQIKPLGARRRRISTTFDTRPEKTAFSYAAN